MKWKHEKEIRENIIFLKINKGPLLRLKNLLSNKITYERFIILFYFNFYLDISPIFDKGSFVVSKIYFKTELEKLLKSSLPNRLIGASFSLRDPILYSDNSASVTIIYKLDDNISNEIITIKHEKESWNIYGKF